MACLDYEEVYCKECSSCGIEGCCPSTMCSGKGGLYCDHYNYLKEQVKKEQEEYYQAMVKKYNMKF